MATTERAKRSRYRPSVTARDAAIAQLYRTEGKAEIIGGKVVIMDGSGVRPGLAGVAILVSLRSHTRSTGSGFALPDGVGFLVDLPDRWSLSPDVAYFGGPMPSGLKFADRAPELAVEVRSEHDYGPAKERAMAAKRADYLAAGTLAVWDVDLLADNPIRVYRDGNAETPATTYRRGEFAEAEPAVPGWRFPVDELFD